MSPLSNNLLHHTIHILPQPPQKSLPDLLLQLNYLGLHNRPHHYLVPPPEIYFLGGQVVAIAAAVGIEGFIVSSVGRRVLCREFQASGSLFLIFGQKTQKHKNMAGKDIPFSCDRTFRLLFSLEVYISKLNRIHYYVNYS